MDQPRAVLGSIAAKYAAATGARATFMLEGRGGLLAAGWKLPPHRTANVWAPHHALDYRLSGIATVSRRCGAVELRKVTAIGSVTFSPGDQPTQWASDAAIEAIHVYIDAVALSRFAERHFEARARIRDFFGVNDPWLAAYFRLLALESSLCDEANGPPASFFLDETEELLLRHLVRTYSDASRGGAHLAHQHTRVSPLRTGVVRRIESYVEANLERHVSLSTLAQMAHMSIDHFIRTFHIATGETPHQFVMERRLRHAAALLETKHVSIAEVARACGFRRAAHFSVKFRARFGATPSDYRRRLGASQASSGKAEQDDVLY